MRRLFLVLLVVALIFGFTSPAFCAATKARSATVDKSPTPPGGISDLSSGDTLEVDSSGRAYVREMGGHTISSGWGTRLVYTGACVVYDVIVQGQTADDYAAVYDATSATGTAKLDPQSATAKKVEGVSVSGAAFSTGIYVVTPNASVLTTVVYDTL